MNFRSVSLAMVCALSGSGYAQTTPRFTATATVVKTVYSLPVDFAHRYAVQLDGLASYGPLPGGATINDRQCAFGVGYFGLNADMDTSNNRRESARVLYQQLTLAATMNRGVFIEFRQVALGGICEIHRVDVYHN